MYLEIDLATAPPRCVLHEADVFTELKVVVREAEHAFIDPEALRHLAGAQAHDAGWRESFDGMVSYAESKGWVGADGTLRAHVEVEPHLGA